MVAAEFGSVMRVIAKVTPAASASETLQVPARLRRDAMRITASVSTGIGWAEADRTVGMDHQTVRFRVPGDSAEGPEALRDLPRIGLV